jgi:hypothetical protein
VTFDLRSEPLSTATCPGAVRAGVPLERVTSFRAYDSTLLSPCDTRVVGEIDPLGTRKDGLDVFLDQKVEEGYTVETRTDTHAIIARRPKGLKRFTSGADPGRFVVEVDEDGVAKMRPAEPRRS